MTRLVLGEGLKTDALDTLDRMSSIQNMFSNQRLNRLDFMKVFFNVLLLKSLTQALSKHKMPFSEIFKNHL